MRSFAGFPEGKTRFTPIPDLFFTEPLRDIGDLAELKVVLYMFWFLHRQTGYPRYMTLAELEGEGLLLSALLPVEGTVSGFDPRAVLREAVECAVQRGVLLRLTIADDAGQETDYLFLNTPQGRKAVERVASGELVLETTGYVREAHVAAPRPNILQLYENNIGLLQPLIVERLKQAERDYPAEWIEDAFRIAVERNARNWRYIESTLERWAHEGKDHGPRRRRSSRRR